MSSRRTGSAAAAASAVPSPSGGAPALGAHYLFPGTLFASDQPTLVTTILATCVSVCLWDPKARVGGIDHYLLPLWHGSGTATARFGATAFELLLAELDRLGASRKRLQAKVFGGMQGRASLSNDLGARNAELAERLLDEKRIPVVGRDVGGAHSRKLLFQTHDGVALVSYF